jgi:hypothetical protein
VSRFSELTRIEAAIKNKSAKELEWSLWYCQMRQKLPTALPSHVKYWAGIEALVKEAIAPPVAKKVHPTRKKKPNRGMGLGPLETNLEDDES